MSAELSRKLSPLVPAFSPAVEPAAFPEHSRSLIAALRRRLTRERRRRQVGRAYDMALEIGRMIPFGAEVLDVGCGNGLIAHHLSSMLGSPVVGIDLQAETQTTIDYRRYDGSHFPVESKSVDAVLLCYVLHHAQDVGAVLKEMRRVLREGGMAVIYEDIPRTAWDRGVCWIHNRQWQGRTGPCTFRLDSTWQSLFESYGFEVVRARRLSRARNFTHPVRRQLYLLRARPNRQGANADIHRSTRPYSSPRVLAV